MKREELTPIDLECNMGPDVNGVVQREHWKAYDIDEVDIFLDKKDSEINELRDECAELHNRVSTLLSQIRIRDERIDELKQRLESVQATAYADSVDAGMRERRLKRALYKACAMWAKCEERINNRDAYDSSEYLPSAEDKFRKNAERWGEMATKCLKKAEEYR